MMSREGISFIATSNNIKPESINPVSCNYGNELREIIKNNKGFDDDFECIIASSVIPNGPRQPIRPARWGLVSTVVDAYNRHHNLTLRPDDIWQAILTQFSFYVNANNESLRNKFVNFDGEKELVVTMSVPDFGSFANIMAETVIPSNIKDPEVSEWLIPNFSTTTRTDRIVASVTLMSTLQAYFSYTCCILCGIPKVTLLGTRDDWTSILKKIDRLLQYDIEGKEPVMKKWHVLLSKVLEEFIHSVEGKDTLKFWDTVVCHRGGGSGPSYLSGWITVFACFEANGSWQGDVDERERRILGHGVPPKTVIFPMIDSRYIPVGTVSVPVKLVGAGPKAIEAKMTSGQVVYIIDEKNLDTIQPRSDWCFAIKQGD